MAWIESHQSLSRHRKTLRVVALLKCDRHKVIGHLHQLWWWALDNVSADGALNGTLDGEIAGGAEWDGDGEAFVAALVNAGFIDTTPEGRYIHDWYGFAGKLLDQRKANAEKQARWRNRNRLSSIEGDNRHVTVTSPSRNAATVPNPTVPNQSLTTPKGSGPAREADASAPPSKTRGNVQVAAVIDALRAEGMTGTLTAKDRAAIQRTQHDPGEVARLYRAIFEGEYGDDFMHDNLSVWLCLEKLPGWLSHRAGHRAPARKNGRAPSGGAAIDALWEKDTDGHGARGGRRGPAVGHAEAGGGVPRQLPG